MRWHYRDPLLAWSFPCAYAAHLVEEWMGGLPEWLAVITGQPLPRGAFVIINAVAFAVCVGATAAATRRERHGWMGVAIASLFFLNGALHLLGSLVTGTYSPGLFTGVVLYLPLGQLALLRAWHQAEGATFSHGVAAGVAVHALVVIVAAMSS
jgi:hypothetical protein